MCLQEQRPSGRKGILLFCHSNPELCASGFQWTNHAEGENKRTLSEISLWTSRHICNPLRSKLHALQATDNISVLLSDKYYQAHKLKIPREQKEFGLFFLRTCPFFFSYNLHVQVLITLIYLFPKNSQQMSLKKI